MFTDLISNSNDNITAAVIGVSGLVGVGQKDVPFKDLKIASRDGKDWLVLNRTKEDLRSAPAYELVGRSVANSASSLSSANWLAKANVYDNAENKIGDVTDLVLDDEGNITTAVIGVGGVLGAGQKDVAVPFKELKVSSRDGKDWYVLNRAKEDLKNAPAYDKKSDAKDVSARIAGCSVFRMEAMMDWNRVEGNWKQLKGKIKEKWGSLRDNEIDKIEGRRDQLESKNQERYGCRRDIARRDWLKTLH